MSVSVSFAHCPIDVHMTENVCVVEVSDCVVFTHTVKLFFSMASTTALDQGRENRFRNEMASDNRVN